MSELLDLLEKFPKSPLGKKILIGIGIFLSLFGFNGIDFCSNLWNNFFKKPNISYNLEDDIATFQVSSDFRGVTLTIHPQLIIQYGENDILLFIHLTGRYIPNFLEFDENGEEQAKRINQAYLDEIKRYLKEQIIKNLTEKKDFNFQEIHMEESLIGAVRYMNQADEINIKYFGIIEHNGLLKSVSLDNQEMQQRLWECKIKLNHELLFTKEEIDNLDELATAITEEIIRIEKDNRGRYEKQKKKAKKKETIKLKT